MTEFRRRVGRVLGSVFAMHTASCGGTAEAPREPTEEEVEAKLRSELSDDYCEEANYDVHVAGLRPEKPQDYIAYRNLYDDVEYISERLQADLPSEEELAALSPEEREAALTEVYEQYMSTQEETGLCDPNLGCSKNVLPETNGFWDYEVQYHYMAYGSGETTFVTNADEMKAFLGAIDSPADAFALASTTAGYRAGCLGNNYAEVDGGYEIYVENGNTCGGNIVGYRLFVSADGTISILEEAVVEEGDTGCAIGRFPGGAVHMAQSCDKHPIAAYFAEVAQLEASSVIAFEELALSLEHHGAPQALIDWAKRAAKEEADHARLCQVLCRRYGGTPQAPRVERRGVSTLFEIALDNAVEGLTREAFGALLAQHQAKKATDPVVARAMQIIADDETGHAEFSLELHAWLLTKLTEAEHCAVLAARTSALLRFKEGAHPERDPKLVVGAGLPDADTSQLLFQRLFQDELAQAKS